MSSESPGSWPHRCPPSLTSRARPRRDGSICVKLSPPRKMLTGKSYRAVPRLYQSTPLFSSQSGPHYVCSGLIRFQNRVANPGTQPYYGTQTLSKSMWSYMWTNDVSLWGFTWKMTHSSSWKQEKLFLQFAGSETAAACDKEASKKRTAPVPQVLYDIKQLK